jgi:hypothetical protein
MSVFELLSCTDDEVELITGALICFSQKNQISLQSEGGQAALRHAIVLVASGIRSPDAMVARLDELCALPADSRGVPRASEERTDEALSGLKSGTTKRELVNRHHLTTCGYGRRSLDDHC